MIEQLEDLIGKSLGHSSWLTVEQQRVDLFAQASNDHDPMHVDPEWAAGQGPFGGTVSFGFLTMSLLTSMYHEVMQYDRYGGDGGYGLNYGFNRMRIISPVPVGSRVRGCFGLLGIEGRGDGQYLVRLDVTVEIEGRKKPALVGEWLVMWVEARRFEALSAGDQNDS